MGRTRSTTSGDNGRGSPSILDMLDEEDCVVASQPELAGNNKGKGKKRVSGSGEERPSKRAHNEEEEYEEQQDMFERAEELGLLDEEDNDDQAQAHRSLLGKGGSGPSSGIIERIYMENFMCHTKLEVNLCPRINFITGQNGSGKSAILAAVQICLGAKANVTHRAKALKDLIRAGGTNREAFIQVTLRNNEQDGWKFQECGRKIVVERRISRVAASTFKIRGEDGRTISTQRKHLIDMLDHLSIQVENPCAVLDQENSKRFLQGQATHKYEFFMRSTNLDGLIAKLSQAAHQYAEMREKVKKDRDGLLPVFRRQWEDAEREMKAFEKLEEFERQIARAKAALVWADVAEHEARVAHFEDTLATKAAPTYERKKAELEQRLEECERGSSQEAALKARLEELAAQSDVVREAVDAHKRALDELQRPWREAQGRAREAEADKQSARGLAARAERRVAEALAQARGQDGARRQAEAKLAQAREQEARADELGTQLEELAQAQAGDREQAAFEEANEARVQARQEAAQKRSQLDKEEQALAGLRRAGGGGGGGAAAALNKFGRSMGAICAQIERQAGQFRRPPLGPVGRYVRVDPAHQGAAAAAEACVEKVLDNFVVACAQDKSKLQRIINAQVKGGRKPTIIIQSAERRYTLRSKPADVLTVAEVLRVEDDMIFNVLVDQCKIDVAAVCESQQAAEGALLLGAFGQHRLAHGLKEVWVTGPTGRDKADHFYVRAGNKTYRTNAGPNHRVLGVEMREQIARRQQIVANIREEVTVLQRLAKEKEEALAVAEQAMFAIEDKRKKLRHQRSAAQRNAQRLQNEADELNAASEEVDTSAWEAQRAEHAAAARAADARAAEHRAEAARLQREMEPLKQLREQEQKKVRELAGEMQAVEDKLDEDLRGQEDAKKQIQGYQRKLQQLEEKYQEALDRGAEVKAARDRAEAEAREVCAALLGEGWEEGEPGGRVDHQGKSKEQIEKLIRRRTEQLKQKREQQALQRKSKQECETQYLRAKAKYRDKEDELKTKWTNAMALQKDIAERMDKYKAFSKFFRRSTNHMFDEYLQQRGSSGGIHFNSNEKTLQIVVQKDNMDEATQTTDIKALSGGERSATTLALLLALGANIECPFRVMDEFDIFMDAMARKLAMQQVIEHGMADFMENRQMILITPQNLKDVEDHPKFREGLISIQRLLPPERLNSNA